MRLEFRLEKKFGTFNFCAEASVEGQNIGVFGPSGSGKSTLVNLLAGLTAADSGFVRLDGKTLFDSKQRINLSPEQRRVGVVFQHALLFPHLSVRDNLFYGHRLTDPALRNIEPDALCQVLELNLLLDRNVTTLSGGERQRVALGRALLACPRLILLDEPLTGLDEGLKFQIIPYLKKVFTQFNIPLIYISHSLNEMRLMTDLVLEFAKGSLLADTSAHALALRSMGTSPVGYINLLELRDPRLHDDLYAYRWGEQEIFLSAGGDEAVGMFELSSKDITLFKRHPEATSARNMIQCRVKRIFAAGKRFGVELDCYGQHLVSQVVGEAVRDLALEPGSEIIAVIKASAFRRLY
jgi:molybdate transport system ATP-binding protein